MCKIVKCKLITSLESNMLDLVFDVKIIKDAIVKECKMQVFFLTPRDGPG